MAVTGFTGIFKATNTKHPVVGPLPSFFIKDMFTIPQLLLIGAVGQIVILSTLPSRYALVPAFLFFLHTAVSTTIQAVSPSRNTFTQDAIPGRTSAQLPLASYDPRTSTPFGTQPARDGIVVLHLGVRLNHPLGFLAPGGKEVSEHFVKCNKDVLNGAKDFGCIGTSTWRAAERSSQNTLLNIFYFRNMEGLRAFAHDKVHREAWNWYTTFAKKQGYTHIGVFHEAFYSPPGGYETVYVHMPPTMLSATSVPTVNEQTGEEEWIRPVVDAEIPVLRSHLGRLGKTVKEEAHGEW